MAQHTLYTAYIVQLTEVYFAKEQLRIVNIIVNKIVNKGDLQQDSAEVVRDNFPSGHCGWCGRFAQRFEFYLILQLINAL